MADDALARLLADRASMPAASTSTPGRRPLDVVLIGDSVFASVNNPADEQLTAFLRQRLQEKGIAARIHNLSAGGLGNLVVLLSTNPIFFSRRHSQPPIVFPCLFDADVSTSAAAEPEPEPAEKGVPAPSRPMGLAPELSRSLGLPRPAPAYERRLARWLAHHSYLYQQRRRMAEALFGSGASPREALRRRMAALHRRPQDRDPALLRTQANRPWHQQGLTAAHYASSYDLIPLTSPAALNWRLTVELSRWLAAHRDLPVLLEQVPQNHAMMGAHTATPAYRDLGQRLADLFSQAAIPYRSHDGDATLTRDMFQDLDHLTATGNRAFAALLAADITATLSPHP
jgi:lysophospholipase L1-like esterase